VISLSYALNMLECAGNSFFHCYCMFPHVIFHYCVKTHFPRIFSAKRALRSSICCNGAPPPAPARKQHKNRHFALFPHWLDFTAFFACFESIACCGDRTRHFGTLFLYQHTPHTPLLTTGVRARLNSAAPIGTQPHTSAPHTHTT